MKFGHMIDNFHVHHDQNCKTTYIDGCDAKSEWKKSAHKWWKMLFFACDANELKPSLRLQNWWNSSKKNSVKFYFRHFSLHTWKWSHSDLPNEHFNRIHEIKRVHCSKCDRNAEPWQWHCDESQFAPSNLF